MIGCNCPEGFDCRCYDTSAREVPCSSISEAELAIGAYLYTCQNDQTGEMYYTGGAIDVGSDVVDFVHGDIVDVIYEVENPLQFYIAAVVGGLALLGTVYLVVSELSKFSR